MKNYTNTKFQITEKNHGLYTPPHMLYLYFSTKCSRLPPTSMKQEKKPLEWKPERNKSFNDILKLVSEITRNKHFGQILDTHVVCDSSTSGLWAALKENSPEGWCAIAYAPFS